ncbi:GatB/YqeY domain-containing protein [Hungatella sp.]|uniref:GatB/YqeY domain-containing protein n=1 Tax=Hungatella sp. TaxID=2613924 RepID=UPI002A7F578B|nr:GatB/YqeY domain-containing protein [Hungatella sp.]
MSKIDVVRAAMVEAMKAKDKQRKDALSMLLSALKNFEIDKKDHEPITEDEANTVVKKEIKQSQETFDTAPADRDDIREEAAYRLSVYKEFAPEDMSEEQIREVVTAVLAELEIEKPTPSDKGRIMKVLMPKVKGKADGKAVNEILASMMK